MACKRSAVRSRVAPPKHTAPNLGAIAQLGERLHGMQEVRGSIPRSSTTFVAQKSRCILQRLFLLWNSIAVILLLTIFPSYFFNFAS